MVALLELHHDTAYDMMHQQYYHAGLIRLQLPDATGLDLPSSALLHTLTQQPASVALPVTILSVMSVPLLQV